MTAAARRVPVTDAATKLNSPPSDNVSGSSIDVKNPSGSVNSIDLGGDGVASGAGYELAPGQSKSFTLDAGEDLFAIAPAAASITVHVLELGV